MDKRTEQAFAYLEKNEHSMMELLKNLVSIVTPSASFPAAGSTRQTSGQPSQSDESDAPCRAHHSTYRDAPQSAHSPRDQPKVFQWRQFMRLESSARNRFL